MSQYDETDVEKVETPPLVHDATHPDASDDDDAGPKTGALVALVGMPTDGQLIRYDAALGYFVPVDGSVLSAAQPMLVRSEPSGSVGFLLDDNGDPMYGYPE